LQGPLTAIAQQAPITLNQRNIYGFVKNTKELIQLLNYRDGRDFPGELAPFLASQNDFPRRQDPDRATELFLIEISAFKELVFRDWYLQASYCARVFAKRFGLYQSLKKHWRSTDRDKRAAALAKEPSFADVNDIERQILLEAYGRSATFQDLEADIQAIRARLSGRIVFVNTINVSQTRDSPAKPREQLSVWMRQICQTHGLAFYDPTALVEHYGTDRALANGGDDWSHYSEDFQLVLGQQIFDLFCAPILTGSPQALPAQLTPWTKSDGAPV
jgi:hypothetical protein